MKRVARGKSLTTPAGVNIESTDITVVKSDGPVIGVSVGENYSRADLSALLISVTSSNNKPLTDVPANLLLPENYPQGKPYFPLDEPFEIGQTITVKIDSKTANSAAATPLIFVTHHES